MIFTDKRSHPPAAMEGTRWRKKERKLSHFRPAHADKFSTAAGSAWFSRPENDKNWEPSCPLGLEGNE